jgi:hypothetical protein
MENISSMVEVMERRENQTWRYAASETSTCLPDYVDAWDDWDFEVGESPEVFQIYDADEFQELEGSMEASVTASLPL